MRDRKFNIRNSVHICLIPLSPYTFNSTDILIHVIYIPFNTINRYSICNIVYIWVYIHILSNIKVILNVFIYFLTSYVW